MESPVATPRAPTQIPPLNSTSRTLSARASSVDWPAILAGAVLAAGLGLVLQAFGAALGFGSLSLDAGDGSPTAMIVVTAVWTVISILVTYMTGGYVAGRMRRRDEDVTGDETSIRDGLHGLVVWALGMIAMAWMALSAVATVASTAANVAGDAAQGAGTVLASGVDAAGQAVGGMDGADIEWISDSLARPGSATIAGSGASADRDELARQSASIVANAARTGEVSEEDRAYLTAATVEITGVSTQEADARVDAAIADAAELRARAESAAATVKAEAVQLAEATRKGAVLTAFLIAAASLAAAAAAVVGGVYGGHHRDENLFFGWLGFRR